MATASMYHASCENALKRDVIIAPLILSIARGPAANQVCEIMRGSKSSAPPVAGDEMRPFYHGNASIRC